MLSRRSLLIASALAASAPKVMAQNIAAASESLTPVGKKVDLSKLPRRKVKLVAPPMVHPHTHTSRHP